MRNTVMGSVQVSHDKLDALVVAAREAGAIGAKMSGTGVLPTLGLGLRGGGGCVCVYGCV